MLRTTIASCLALASLTLAGAAGAADDFGSPGVILSGERLMPLVAYQSMTTTPDNTKTATTDSRPSPERCAIRLGTTNLLREHLGTAGGVKLSILRSQGLPVGAHSGIAVNSHVPFSIFEHNI